MHANDEFFMTELKVREILSKLKVKNCEGIDRIPLRILNEGAISIKNNHTINI